jgi:hypothetical protein
MPARTNTKVEKYIIYKISCLTVNVTECYYGSTYNYTNRKYHHKNSCCNVNDKYYNQRKYQFIREHGGWKNWLMRPIEELVCDKLTAEIREQYYIDLNKGGLNSNNSYSSPEQLAEYKRQKSSQYYIENKQHVCEYNKLHKNRKSIYDKKRSSYLEEVKRFRNILLN